MEHKGSCKEYFIVISVMIVVFIGTNLSATDWIDYSLNPVHSPLNRAYKACVLWDHDQYSGHGDSVSYKMYYAKKDATDYYLGYASSIDGQVWSGDTDLGLGYGKTWARVVYDVGQFDEPSGPYYKMWYSDLSTTKYSIGYAYSDDGMTWTDYGIVINGDIEGQNLFDMWVVYQADGDNIDPVTHKYLGFASKTETVTFFYSSDGISWTNGGQLTDQGLNPTVIPRKDGAWWMWVSQSGLKAGSNNIKIDFYEITPTTDGNSFDLTLDQEPIPVVGSTGEVGTWNEICNYAPAAVIDAFGLKFYRSGRDASQEYGIGLAWTGNWKDYGQVFSPGRAYYPSVLYDQTQFSSHGEANLYKMWYTSRDVGGNYVICYAVSDDGFNWIDIKPADDPVVGLSNAHHVRVIYDQNGFDVSGYYYKIWYWDLTQLYSIDALRYAESTDGKTWTNDQSVTQFGTTVISGVSPDWNRGSYGPMAVFYNASGSDTFDDTNVWNNKYILYYDGTTGGTEQIGLAYSYNGTYWKGYNDGLLPVLDHGSTGVWDGETESGTGGYAAIGSVVRLSENEFELWYSGGITSSNKGIGYAYSSDGINWTKSAYNPLFSLGGFGSFQGLGTTGSWNEDRNYTPYVIYDSAAFGEPGPCQSHYKIWRSGRSTAGVYSLGFAVSDIQGSYFEPVGDVGNSLLIDNGLLPDDIICTWAIVTSADHYHVYRGTEPDFDSFPPTLVKKSYLDEDAITPDWQCELSANTGPLYFYKIYAANPCDGESTN